MKKYIAFLRAINVGGHNVKMDELKTLFEQQGFADVKTFIASGNVIFDSNAPDLQALEQKIESALEEALGYEVVTFLRSVEEVTAIANYKAFDESQMAESRALNVGFLKQALDKKSLAVLESLKNDIDDFHAAGREVYWLCKLKQSQSKFNNNVFEKTLKLRATFRGMRTIERLAVKYPPD
jgi:uncharacterized protein (DUF1697 family)